MIRSLLDGITAYGKAFALIGRLNLWGYFFVPALISLVLAVLIFGGAWYASDDIAGWVMSIYPFEWGQGVIKQIIRVFGGIFVVVVGLILYKALVIALASPFMSPLSERIERHVTGSTSGTGFNPKQFLSDVWRGLRIGLRLVVRELFLTFVLFLIGLIPLLTPLTTVLIFLVQAYYAGAGNMDFTLERFFRVRGSIAFVRRHRWMAVGNGIVYLLILFTFVGFLFALPFGTVAATLETVKRLQREQERVS